MSRWELFVLTAQLALMLGVAVAPIVFLLDRKRHDRTETDEPLWRRLLASALGGLGLGWLLLGLASTGACVTVSGLELVTAQATPGGFASLQGVEGRESVGGKWRGVWGRFEPRLRPGISPREEGWKVVFDDPGGWGAEILDQNYQRFFPNGDIVIPADRNLAGETIEGTLVLEVLYPLRVGRDSFRNELQTITSSYTVSVSSPSPLRDSLVVLDRIGWAGNLGFVVAPVMFFLLAGFAVVGRG